jgi:hypothetical protein
MEMPQAIARDTNYPVAPLVYPRDYPTVNRLKHFRKTTEMEDALTLTFTD